MKIELRIGVWVNNWGMSVCVLTTAKVNLEGIIWGKDGEALEEA